MMIMIFDVWLRPTCAVLGHAGRGSRRAHDKQPANIHEPCHLCLLHWQRLSVWAWPRASWPRRARSCRRSTLPSHCERAYNVFWETTLLQRLKSNGSSMLQVAAWALLMLRPPPMAAPPRCIRIRAAKPQAGQQSLGLTCIAHKLRCFSAIVVTEDDGDHDDDGNDADDADNDDEGDADDREEKGEIGDAGDDEDEGDDENDNNGDDDVTKTTTTTTTMAMTTRKTQCWQGFAHFAPPQQLQAIPSNSEQLRATPSMPCHCVFSASVEQSLRQKSSNISLLRRFDG